MNIIFNQVGYRIYFVVLSEFDYWSRLVYSELWFSTRLQEVRFCYCNCDKLGNLQFYFMTKLVHF